MKTPLELITQHNDSARLSRKPFSFALGERIYTVATDGYILVVVLETGQPWESPEDEELPYTQNGAMQMACRLPQQTQWQGTLDALLLKELAGEPDWARAWDKHVIGPMVSVQGCMLLKHHAARALGVWHNPSASFGYLPWPYEPSELDDVEEARKLEEETGVDPNDVQALVLTCPDLWVAIAPFAIDLNSASGQYVVYPKDAIIQDQYVTDVPGSLL